MIPCPGVVHTPAQRGRPKAVNSGPGGAEFPPRMKNKRAPAGPDPRESNAQKPVYVNTVWGYGYKWR